MSEELEVTVHVCTTQCKDGEHDWSGPWYERKTAGGGGEGGATCAKCGIEFGNWALHNLD